MSFPPPFPHFPTLLSGVIGLIVMVSPAPLAALELRAGTLNIRYENNEDAGERAWPERLHRIVTCIRSLDVDVLGIQEALQGQVADLCASLPDYHYYGGGRDDGRTGGEHCGIFYRHRRWSPDFSDAGLFWLSDTPEVAGSRSWGNELPRMVTWLRLRQLDGASFTVWNTHWDHRHQGSRLRAARLIAQRIDQRRHREDPVLLLGDFNATEGNEAVDYLAGRVPGWANALCDGYDQLHSQQRQRRTLHFWKNNRDGWAKIDHILASKPVTFLQATIHNNTREHEPYSDHYAVSSTLRWPSAATPPPQGLRLSPES